MIKPAHKLDNATPFLKTVCVLQESLRYTPKTKIVNQLYFNLKELCSYALVKMIIK